MMNPRSFELEQKNSNHINLDLQSHKVEKEKNGFEQKN